MIKVLLIGRQPISLAGLAALIDREPGLEVIGQWLGPADASSSLRPNGLDVALVDHSDGDALAPLTAMVTAIEEDLKSVLLTSSTNSALISSAFRGGVRGVVSKRQEPPVLMQALRSVHAGNMWLDGGLGTSLITHLLRPGAQPGRPDRPALDHRDHQIIALVGEGLTNKQIADRLHVSPATVRNRLTSIFRRLGLTGRLELVVHACQRGFVEVPLPATDPTARSLRLVRLAGGRGRSVS